MIGHSGSSEAPASLGTDFRSATTMASGRASPFSSPDCCGGGDLGDNPAAQYLEHQSRKYPLLHHFACKRNGVDHGINHSL